MFGYLKDIIRQLRVILLHAKACGKASRLHAEEWGRVLIIAPHPDDEVLGCGGLIARLVKEGNPPHIVLLTRGEHSHAGCCSTPEQEIIEGRRKLTMEALHTLGVPSAHLHTLSFADGKVDVSNRTEMKKLEDVLKEVAPDCVLVPHWGEGWNDHIQVKSMVLPLLPSRTSMYEYCVWMWYYNVWKLNWPQAQLLKLTGEEYRLKRKASAEYVEPLAPCGKPWSGVLPKPFLKATQWKNELYFKVR